MRRGPSHGLRRDQPGPRGEWLITTARKSPRYSSDPIWTLEGRAGENARAPGTPSSEKELLSRTRRGGPGRSQDATLPSALPSGNGNGVWGDRGKLVKPTRYFERLRTIVGLIIHWGQS